MLRNYALTQCFPRPSPPRHRHRSHGNLTFPGPPFYVLTWVCFDVVSAAQVGQLAHSFPYHGPFSFWKRATLGLPQPKSYDQDQHGKVSCQKAPAYCDGNGLRMTAFAYG
ncbi:hypothetical protein M514_06097 [Trichuris suis]|uniref:Uncharacterized protein n=1 Tax=Trichuris suis TaxID=68888 RepID=A0A085M6Y5_9BILA|nr:hypothetical protein M513_06097 [Trichuris suis]KFD69890.1 hypothetical protein M514_06097 [Trichuris suis]